MATVRPFEKLRDVEIIQRLDDRLGRLPIARRARILSFLVEQINEEILIKPDAYEEPVPRVASPFDQ